MKDREEGGEREIERSREKKINIDITKKRDRERKTNSEGK